MLSHHALSTNVISLSRDGRVAKTKTYLTATHFGHGSYEGEIYVAYGRYEDELVRGPEGWRIKRRHLMFMVTRARFLVFKEISLLTRVLYSGVRDWQHLCVFEHKCHCGGTQHLTCEWLSLVPDHHSQEYQLY